MNQQAIETLMDKWINEPQFREEMRQNPQSAAANAGVDLDKDDLETLSSVDWSLSDEELQSRISKAG